MKITENSSKLVVSCFIKYKLDCLFLFFHYNFIYSLILEQEIKLYSTFLRHWFLIIYLKIYYCVAPEINSVCYFTCLLCEFMFFNTRKI